ncbi:MAG: hypothetical protein PHN59_04435 [Candidatus Omnitrophica bacterium]|nr:hypothetical protein [Candidatus Omnitrophota bacterium]
MWRKGKIAAIIISLLVFFSVNSLYASWWDMKTLPVPGHTQKIKENNYAFEGAEFDAVYYSSTLDTQRISDFYRNKLPKLGWQERDLTEQLNEIRGPSDIPELGGFLGGALIFRKDNDTIVIRFISQGEKETKYILGKNKLFLEKNLPMDIASLPTPDLEIKHKNIPQYSDAKLINLKEGADFFNATYLSKADPAIVVKFYKNNLLSNGWKLNQEKSPNKVYPTKMKSFYKGLQLGVLDFSKANGETCRIHVIHHILDENNAINQSNITYITIAYEK